MQEYRALQINDKDIQNVKLRKIVRKIQSTMFTLSLSVSEIQTIIKSGYLSAIKKLIIEGDKVQLYLSNISGIKGTKEVLDCKKSSLDKLGVELFSRFQTTSDKVTLLGINDEGLWFLDDSSKDCSVLPDIMCYDNILSEGFLPLSQEENQLNIGIALNLIETLRVHNALRPHTPQEMSFFKRFENALANDYTCAINMLAALVNRYKKQDVDVVLLPTDEMVIQTLFRTLNEKNYQIFEALIKHFSDAKELLQKNKIIDDSKDGLWNLVFKQCLIQAIEFDLVQAVDLLTGIEFSEAHVFNSNPLRSSDFTLEEIKKLMVLVKGSKNTDIVATLMLNGIFEANNIESIAPYQKKFPAIKNAEQFYSLLENKCEKSIILGSFLNLINDKCNGLMILKLFLNVIQSIPNFDSNINLEIVKTLVLQLHLCYEGEQGEKFNVFKDIMTNLYILDFDAIKNKTLFSSNEEKKVFFRKEFNGLIPAMDTMQYQNENINNLQSKMMEGEKLIATEVASDLLLEELRIAIYDEKAPGKVFELISQVSTKKLANYAEFLSKLEASLPESCQTLQEYLQKAKPTQKSSQIIQFSTVLNNNNNNFKDEDSVLHNSSQASLN